MTSALALSFSLLAAIVFNATLYSQMPLPREPVPLTPFDSQVWKATKSTKDTGYVRQKMADDLLRQNILIGKSRGEVEAVLGAPDDTEYFRSYDMVYFLGPERGYMSLDSEWFVIRFDEHGKVAVARMVQD